MWNYCEVKSQPGWPEMALKCKLDRSSLIRGGSHNDDAEQRVVDQRLELRQCCPSLNVGVAFASHVVSWPAEIDPQQFDNLRLVTAT